MWLIDGLMNLVTGLGTPKDKVSHWKHSNENLSPEEISAIYASDWLGRKIVNVIPQDMTREWRTWQFEEAEALYQTEKRFKVRSKVKRALILARLYGGSAILLGDGASKPDRPFNPESVGRDGLKYLHVFSRHELSVQEDAWIDDIENEDFGRPEFYRLIKPTREVSDQKIHRSRLVFFYGEENPNPCYSDASNYEGWGIPLFDFIKSVIVHAGSTVANAAALVEESKLDVYKIPNLHNYLADKESTNKLITRFTLANSLKSTINALILGGDEEFERKQVSFAGIPELIRQNLDIACAAADVPQIRLLGIAPGGLNASGDTDIRNYYDKIRTGQTTDLQDALEVLDEVLIRTTLGDRPEECVYEWDPLWQLTEGEKAEIFTKKVNGFNTLNSMSLWLPEELRPTFSDTLIDDGILPTLDQHLMDDDIAQLLMEQQAAQVAGLDPATGQPIEEGQFTEVDPRQQQQQIAFQESLDRWKVNDKGWKEELHPRNQKGEFTFSYSETMEQIEAMEENDEIEYEEEGKYDREQIRDAFAFTCHGIEPRDFLRRLGVPSDSMATLSMVPGDGGMLQVSSVLKYNGEMAGDMEILIHPYKRYAYIGAVHIDDKAQGHGLAKKLIADQVELFKDMGHQKVTLTANLDVGSYAWARYGFVPDKQSWGYVKDVAKARLNAVEGLSKSDKVAMGKLLRSSDPMTIWAISDATSKVTAEIDGKSTKTTIGKALLLDQSWEGVLNFRSAAQMERFNAYIR